LRNGDGPPLPAVLQPHQNDEMNTPWARVIDPSVTKRAGGICPIQDSKSDICPPESQISFADHEPIWMIRTPRGAFMGREL
jgi:hypothetical protein